MEPIRCMLMRGGTSKGAYFLADDLPDDPADRDQLLLRVMGTPDPRQIDGIGGADPLTSKVAVISVSQEPDIDVDYLFLQVGVEKPTVTDRQNCGNILAGVGPFAVERGLVRADHDQTEVRIRMINSDSVAVARFATPGGVVEYAGNTAISGVPGTAAPVVLDFADTEGSAGHGLWPTGNLVDVIEQTKITCVDNGMPVVLARAVDLGLTGYESASVLAADDGLRDRLQSLRLGAARIMGLGDVSASSVPKITLLAPPADGGTICTRTFIPLRPHTSIGVLGGVSVATALVVDGTVGHDLAVLTPGISRIDLEHPSGHFQVEVEVDDSDPPPRLRRSGVIRTARRLFDGEVFVR